MKEMEFSMNLWETKGVKDFTAGFNSLIYSFSRIFGYNDKSPVIYSRAFLRMSYLLVDMDYLPARKTEYVIADFILPLPVPVNSLSIPRYLASVFFFTVPSAGITYIGEYS
ncbi:MAG TPA: hypothetical protein H9848_11375 [Candidatus Parabacteroides intestinigallinarum]|uniref:Uncharacterized protein n=1 Tax=Candidatus Parabacteroides intestinigallinarum TaxID=2838722 RepID=A0A9D1XTD0_9BACT|nr:hypothetical protein [Candidatus Parabacteroides intestinigallinarum]